MDQFESNSKVEKFSDQNDEQINVGDDKKRKKNEGKNGEKYKGKIKIKGKDIVENEAYEYHYKLVKKNSHILKKKLLEWYYKYRRKLPWRNDQPPYTTNINIKSQITKDGDIRNYFLKTQDNTKLDDKIDKTNKNTIIQIKNSDEFLTTKITNIKKNNVNDNNIEEIKESIENEKMQTLNFLDTNILKSENFNKKIENIPKLINQNEEIEKLKLRGYQIYISEVMLQQTKVATVLNFYLKWMNKWPTIFDLVKSNLDDILTEWKGLGYYNRAKNLLDCCKIVVNKYNGIFPNDLKLLKELPGIGNYTAKAISIHLYNSKDICIDTNIIRIFSRITDTINYYGSTILSQHCEEVSNILCIGAYNYSDFNQALMDLGSSICSTYPQCSICPLNKYCLIYLKENKKKIKNKRRKINEKIKITLEINQVSNSDHPNNCKLCAKDRNVDIKLVPLARSKKKKKKICLVLIIKKSDSYKVNTKENQNKEHLDNYNYLMVKNTDSNLFLMHYLFPFILIDNSTPEVYNMYLNSLLSRLSLNNTKSDSFIYVGNFKHVFSHLVYDTYIYTCFVQNSENANIGYEHAWIKLKDIKGFMHNSFCENIIEHYKKSVSEKKTIISEFFE
ncbi:A/G-specific adenine glycosylase, putative [Plasmodium berghei]|uniref:A/G-specific adenine glycosylase, putative n=2 Tax=Plasmodium berghei TaxID=5821 RepID=A0A509AII9_PLABA|nr:A/G-specific adenine glycosylase, putative [Plasmodium berghei ANKA]CXI42410.1 A/G-specific adenine glycosylase, putative [Plasmodium berghei]SCM22114.1 A/G-specific adenine glycosylase, putative [Plasmodium berghei]SCN25286.1 A/G-specific adenine glycosylase, putative [Plasmodium berghei]SCO60262.1 A/G-specific adenine glycosylase, putative [Plasmodium berghei]SCO61929.1 A/G-specific adenine glycosylase, putative [Plasmodium berghei]|eukprot:XP_034421538.1 A/G-specific adenine glycosylase, putative [Plasmodium berghei ANKA]